MAAGRQGRAEVPRWAADASIMAAAAASSALKRLDLRDPAALFETHGAEEIRGLERQVRAEIEHKKEELRQMVGERYRDLIEAADTIGQMRRCAAGLVDAVRATDQYCARLRQAGSAAPRPPRDPQVSPAPAPRPGPTRLRRRPRRPLPPRPAWGTPAALPALLAGSPRLLRTPPGLRASPPSPQSWGRRASFPTSHGNARCSALFPVGRHGFGNRVLPCVDHLPSQLVPSSRPPPPLHSQEQLPGCKEACYPLQVVTSPQALIF